MSESEESDITPMTHFLESVRSDHVSHISMSKEAADNAFDAGASRVEFVFTPEWIKVTDNGVGITKKRELAIVTLGDHQPMPTTMLGMFGIGLKYHAISAAEIMEVDSISVDGHMTLNVDWRKILRTNRWKITRPAWAKVAPSKPFGTTILLHVLRSPVPTPKEVDKICEELSQTFYPALQAGCSIIVNGRRCQPTSEPLLKHTVNVELQLKNGKGAKIHAGITVNLSKLYQVQVSYKHRVILSKSAFGCDEYTGLRKLFARVELTGPWILKRFKDGLADPDAAELEDRVHQALLPLLKECHSEQMDARIDEMAAELNNMLPEGLRPARPRNKKDTPSEPAKKGKKGKKGGVSKDADITDKGPAKTPRPKDVLKIAFDGPLNEEYGYGHFEQGRPNRVTLSLDNPLVAQLLAIRDKQLGATSLYTVAIMIYLQALESLALQAKLPGMDAPYGRRAWSLVVKQDQVGEAIESGKG